jgi:hypothetical protein
MVRRAIIYRQILGNNLPRKGRQGSYLCVALPPAGFIQNVRVGLTFSI